MFKKTLLVLLLSLALLALAACGGGDAETPAETNPEAEAIGNAENGETLFAQANIGANNAPGCITCHSL